MDAAESEIATDASDDDDDDDDVVVLSWWQHPANVIALVIAALLIAGMVGWLVGEASPSADDGGPVDIGFLQDMRIHHEQAVQMAMIYGDLEDTDPGLRTIADSILITQNLDIGQMIQMLRIIGAPEAAETDEAMAWMGMPTTHDAMPGMASEDDLVALAESSGAEADRLFVELMVAHHQGGLHMARVRRRRGRERRGAQPRPVDRRRPAGRGRRARGPPGRLGLVSGSE